MPTQPFLFDVPPKLAAPKITSSLKEKAILVDFDGGHYNWERRDRRVEREVTDSHALSQSAGKYLKNLFLSCDAPLRRIVQCVQAARSTHDNMTLPWTPGRNLLLNVNVLPYTESQAKHQANLEEAKSLLADTYETMIASSASALGPLFNREDYPELGVMLSACYVRHKFYALSDETDVRLKVDSEIVAEIQAQIRAEQAETYSSAVLSTWARLGDILKSATSNLSKNLDGSPSTDRFRTEWYDKLDAILPLLKGLNLDGDPRLITLADRCADLLTRTGPDEYKVSVSARAAAYTKAQAIYDDLSAIYVQKGGTK